MMLSLCNHRGVSCRNLCKSINEGESSSGQTHIKIKHSKVKWLVKISPNKEFI